MLGELFAQHSALCHFKVCEIKTGRHRAAHQAIIAPLRRARTEPAARRHIRLKYLACLGIWPQCKYIQPAIGVYHYYFQRIARIKVPALIAGYAVQGRKVALFQHIIYTGGKASVATEPTRQGLLGNGFSRAVYLFVPAAFRVWKQLQVVYPVSGVVRCFVAQVRTSLASKIKN